jgi:hypothetical protein
LMVCRRNREKKSGVCLDWWQTNPITCSEGGRTADYFPREPGVSLWASGIHTTEGSIVGTDGEQNRSTLRLRHSPYRPLNTITMTSIKNTATSTATTSIDTGDSEHPRTATASADVAGRTIFDSISAFRTTTILQQ